MVKYRLAAFTAAMTMVMGISAAYAGPISDDYFRIADSSADEGYYFSELDVANHPNTFPVGYMAKSVSKSTQHLNPEENTAYGLHSIDKAKTSHKIRIDDVNGITIEGNHASRVIHDISSPVTKKQSTGLLGLGSEYDVIDSKQPPTVTTTTIEPSNPTTGTVTVKVAKHGEEANYCLLSITYDATEKSKINADCSAANFELDSKKMETKHYHELFFKAKVTAPTADATTSTDSSAATAPAADATTSTDSSAATATTSTDSSAATTTSADSSAATATTSTDSSAATDANATPFAG